MNQRLEPGRLTGRPFARMNGLGNAIVVLDLRGCDLAVTADDARMIAAAPGLAFDQLMVIHDPVAAGSDAHLRIFNVDGSVANACGNGTRCVAWFMLKASDRNSLVLTTAAGQLACERVDAFNFAVDMGAPQFGWDRIPLREPVDPSCLDVGIAAAPGPAFALGMGNPHAVFFVPDVDAVDLGQTGPLIETAAIFPERVNVSFAQVLDRHALKLRVWERGAGATLACGSGACATLVAAASTGRTARSASVDLPGGRLHIAWRDDGHVIMTGPVEVEFEGTLDPAPSADQAA
jgi:diaminopimelate epimerase